MGKNTLLIHFQVVGGTPDQIEAVSKALIQIKENLNFDVQFLVSNEQVKMQSVDYLLKELIKLYKMNNKTVDDRGDNDEKNK